MATREWLGKATPVAQVATATFATYDVATTRTITIGGVSFGLADSGGTLAAALTAFAAYLNTLTHPYFQAITWSSDATKIIGTADVAGCPFTFAGSVSGGTGTLTNAYTITTANAGPNDWSSAANWSGSTVPVDGDTVIFASGSVPVCWGLELSDIELAKLEIRQAYTGKIGLRRTEFATSANGATYSATSKPEYREDYLTIDATLVEIGEHFGPGSPAGAGRIKIDLGTTQTTVTIHNTCRTPADTGMESVRLLMTNSSSILYVREAPGGVGVASDAADETSTLSLVSVGEATTDTVVRTGPGVTLTTWDQRGGTGVLEAAATVTTVTVSGGALSIEGTFAITTLNVEDGTVSPNGTGTITTLNLKGGGANFLESNQPRTVTTFKWWKTLNGTFDLDPDVVTLTNQVQIVGVA